jgi:hypothetical protein
MCELDGPVYATVRRTHYHHVQSVDLFDLPPPHEIDCRRSHFAVDFVHQLSPAVGGFALPWHAVCSLSAANFSTSGILRVLLDLPIHGLQRRLIYTSPSILSQHA